MSARSRIPTVDPAEQRKDPAWRAQAGDAARKSVEAAAGRGGTLEERLHEASTTMQATQMGVPVNFKTGQGKRKLEMAGRNAQVVGATAGDIEKFSLASGRTCGLCRYFDLEVGRREMVKQRFGERLVLEQEWKMQHLGAPIDHMGMCKASGGTMVTSTVTNAGTCDQFRPKSRLFG